MLEVTADDSPYLRRDNFPAVGHDRQRADRAAGPALMRRLRAPRPGRWRARWRPAAAQGPRFPPRRRTTRSSTPARCPTPPTSSGTWPARPAGSTAASRPTARGRSPPARASSIADIDVGVDLDHPDLAGRWLVNPGETGTDSARPRPALERRRRRSQRLRRRLARLRLLRPRPRRGLGHAQQPRHPGRRRAGRRHRQRHGHRGHRARRGDPADPHRGQHPAPVGPAGRGDRLRGRPRRRRDEHEPGHRLQLGRRSTAPRATPPPAAPCSSRRRATSSTSTTTYPGALDQTITVGGLNPDTANTTALNGSLALIGTDFKVRAAYSDYGPHLDVVAPTQVPTTEYGGGYTLNWSGTSAATPHVAGVAALVLARGKALGPEAARARGAPDRERHGQDLADPAKDTRPGWDRLTGYGRVDAFAAVSSVRPGTVPPEVDITAPAPFQPANRDRMAVTGLRARALAHALDARARRGRGAAAAGARSPRAARPGGARGGSPRWIRGGSPPAGTRCACGRPTPTATAARIARSSSPCATACSSAATRSGSAARASPRPSWRT